MNEQNTAEKYRLNALADGELDTAETEQLLKEIKQDRSLQRELCDIHLVKDMVKSAYPEQEKTHTSRKTNWLNFSAVAASVLILGVGFLIGNQFQSNISPDGFTISMVEQQPNKIVMYLGESGEQIFLDTLSQAEDFLRQNQNSQMKVDIVVSAGGIDLLRKTASPHLSKVSEMSQQYDALAFVACNNTLARLKREGKNTDIISEAVIAPSAVQYVVKRLQQGWSYVAI